MFVRIVKLSFHETHIDAFLEIFESSKQTIRHFEGCQFLELYRDKHHSNIFFTYSYWRSEEDLEAYRHSDYFNSVWRKTKVLFNAKPEAWSVDKLASIE